MQEWFVPILIEIGLIFHSKRFSPIYTCVNLFPFLWPLPSPGDHILYKLEFPLCQKAYMSIWPILAQWLSMRQFFNELTPFLWLSLIWQEPALYLDLFFKIIFNQRWFVRNLIEIGLLVLEIDWLIIYYFRSSSRIFHFKIWRRYHYRRTAANFSSMLGAQSHWGGRDL
jgi:hypothetical protein